MDISTFIALFENKEEFVQWFTTHALPGEMYQLGQSAYDLSRVEHTVNEGATKVELTCSCGLLHVLHEKEYWAIHDHKIWIARAAYHEISSRLLEAHKE